MTTATNAIAKDWRDALGLSARRAPDVYSDAAAVGDLPRAGPIRKALRDIDPSAVRVAVFSLHMLLKDLDVPTHGDNDV